jgi:hypothetical protein
MNHRALVESKVFESMCKVAADSRNHSLGTEVGAITGAGFAGAYGYRRAGKTFKKNMMKARPSIRESAKQFNVPSATIIKHMRKPLGGIRVALGGATGIGGAIAGAGVGYLASKMLHPKPVDTQSTELPTRTREY